MDLIAMRKQIDRALKRTRLLQIHDFTPEERAEALLWAKMICQNEKNLRLAPATPKVRVLRRLYSAISVLKPQK
jgi:hypothetical protein